MVHTGGAGPPLPRAGAVPLSPRGAAELDTFNFIEDLKIASEPLVSVLTATVHGVLADAWIMEQSGAKPALEPMLERWRREGLPGLRAVRQRHNLPGARRFRRYGRADRPVLCLALEIVPCSAPPREPGFQNAIEGFNALFGRARSGNATTVPMSKLLEPCSQRYITACRAKTAPRGGGARRRPFSRHSNSTSTPRSQGTLILPAAQRR